MTVVAEAPIAATAANVYAVVTSLHGAAMSTVSAREANQHFSKFLDAASRGEEVTITRRGKPVAKLVPIQVAEDLAEVARKDKRREEALEFFRKGVPSRSQEPWTRDELYEERLRHLLKDDE
jgi:prevent-host-death family protein